MADGAKPGVQVSNHLLALRTGMATACGSLPHADPVEAIELLVDTVGGLPAAPTLPNRHAAEGMLGQAASGIDGVTVADDGTILVEDPDAVDAEPVGDAAGDLPEPAFGSVLDFLDDLAARRRARALVATAKRRLPRAALVVVVDEPSLGAASLGDAPIGIEDAVDLVSGALAAVEADAVSGLHCCASADWGVVLRAGPQLLSIPVEVGGGLRAADVGPFLDRGGWIAWGAVPTDGPLATVDSGATARFWRHLTSRWHWLADGGVDPVLLRRRALVTPACGLARHDVAQAALALRLTAGLGQRVAAGTVDEEHRLG